MKCLSCGTELENGRIYCGKCGEEVQIVSDINTLEEDVLMHLMNEEEASSYGNGEETAHRDGYEAEPAQHVPSGKRNKFFYFILVDAIAVCIVSMVVLFYFR